MGKVFLETPAQASLLQGLKKAVTSDATKVKNQMENAAKKFERCKKSIVAIEEDLLSDISRGEDKDMIQAKLAVLKLKLKELREILIKNMAELQSIYGETYKELAMEPKAFKEYSNPDAFWLKDGGLAASGGRSNFRGGAEKRNYVEGKKKDYETIIKENISGVEKIKQKAKGNTSLPFSGCCKLIGKDCEEVSLLVGEVSDKLENLESLLKEVGMLSGTDAINGLHEACRALEVACALLSQIQFFDDILGVREWRN
jgi:hypothetical protein